jgi:hypothetical protein
MNNEPVAIRYDFDGYGYQYMDSGSGSDWQTRVDGELLYAHPACKHGVDDGACKECYQDATEPVKELHLSLQKSKQTGELLAVTYTDDQHRIVEVLWQRPPELTDEEILEICDLGEWHRDEFAINFARAILRKAQEK